MYAIKKLDPATAMQFRPLVPFELRHVLRDFAALPRVHAIGATLMGRPVGVVLAAQGWSAPDALGGTAPSADTARLLAVTVARSYRRLGIARALLGALDQMLLEHGATTMQCNYAIGQTEGRLAADALFRSAGWTVPDVTMLQCRADHALLEAPVMQEQLTLPPEYEIIDWVDLLPAERAHIAERQREQPWYPEALDPFHFEPELEVINSLALRYRGEVVGWLITRRTSATTMYYRSMFVRSDLARLGRGMALIGESVRRHAEYIGAQSGYGEWSTPASLPLMVRFIRRHLEPYGTTVIEQCVVRKQLNDVVDPPAGLSRVELKRKPRQAVDQTEFLSLAERERALAAVLDARSNWREQFDTLPFHTYGANALVDAWESRAQYDDHIEQSDATLRAQFAWLYEKLHVAIAHALRAPVTQYNELAVPSFQIWQSSRGSHLPIAPVRCDLGHQYVSPGEAYALRPVSFVVCLSASGTGAGLTVWDIGYDEVIGLDTEETARLLDAVPHTTHQFVPGELFMFGSDTFHQRTPLVEGEVRVTLEGRAVYVDGMWRVYS